MKIKKICLILLCILFVAVLSVGESETSFTKINEIEENSRVFEVYYDCVDYDYGDKFWAENNDNWGGGCTAVSK